MIIFYGYQWGFHSINGVFIPKLIGGFNHVYFPFHIWDNPSH